MIRTKMHVQPQRVQKYRDLLKERRKKKKNPHHIINLPTLAREVAYNTLHLHVEDTDREVIESNGQHPTAEIHRKYKKETCW